MIFQRYRLVVLGLAAMTLAACAHPISKDTRSSLSPGVTFAAVSENPAAFIDQRLMVGGVIVAHESKEDASLLEVMEWQINRFGEPTYLDDSARRFLVRSSEKLDPVLYEPGTMVTLAGTVLGQEERIIEAQSESYPLLDLVEIHLWKSPFRYGVHHYDPAYPTYVGDESDDPDRHPYDPGYSGYPYTPFWYRDLSR